MNGKQEHLSILQNGSPLETTDKTPCGESSFVDFRASGQALEVLLRNPIRFVPATHLTLEDEKRLAPILRLQTPDQDSKVISSQRKRKSLVGWFR